MLNLFRDLIFTPTCIGCSALGEHLCSRCRAGVEPKVYHAGSGPAAIHYASPYGGWLRDALVAYKNGSRRHVLGLAQVLHQVLLHVRQEVSFMEELSLIVPMPSTPDKVALRGFDTMELLVREALKLEPKIPARMAKALCVQRQVEDQVGLSAPARRKNVDHSLAIRFPVPGTVLIVDDVVTTGSTMYEANRVLRLGGASKVFGISLCGSTKWG
jgi:predicted amidophosphoribosyltransferase